MTEYNSLAALRNDYEQQLAAIETNDELPDRARHRRTAQLKQEFRDHLERTLTDIGKQEDAELRSAFAAANPAPDLSKLTPGQLAERADILEDIADMDGEGILDLYAKFHATGYELGMDTIAQRGHRYLSHDQLRELKELEEYRKPSLKEARTNYEQLKAEQASKAQGRALMADNLRASTELSAEESDALAKAQAGQQPVEAGATQDGGAGNDQ